MPTRILGISAYYHDSAACLVEDGRIVAAAQEERFTRKKHDAAFPVAGGRLLPARGGHHARRSSISSASTRSRSSSSTRLLETYVACAPRGLQSYLMAMPLWLSEKLWMADDIARSPRGLRGRGAVRRAPRIARRVGVLSRRPSSRRPIVTMDGVGEWATSSIGVGRGHELELLHELRFPHSLGLLYSAFTYFTGFKVNSGEYKVMGLAPYGEPKYVKTIKDHLRRDPDDGSLWMNHGVLHLRPRPDDDRRRAASGCSAGRRAQPESQLTQREMDLARSIQDITEEVMLKMTAFAHRETGMRDLCLAGGVALNCVGNGRILREGPFEQIWIQPAAGDAGGALGVALSLWHRHLRQAAHQPRGAPARGSGRRPCASAGGAARYADGMNGSYLGPQFREAEIAALRRRAAAGSARRVDRAGARRRSRRAAGGGEGRRAAAGPHGVRAARARRPLDHRRRAVAEDAVGDEPEDQVPRVVPAVRAGGAARARRRVVRARRRQPLHAAGRRRAADRAGCRCRPRREALWGIDKLNVPRSTVPAITHVDYSARIQTVRRETSPLYYDIIEAFYRRTGCPVIVNTSFNVRGEPIVCTPEDAYRCFMRTDMDVLVLENFMLEKTRSSRSAPKTSRGRRSSCSIEAARQPDSTD